MLKLDTIKSKKVRGRVKLLKALPYKGNMYYIRMIGKDYFEYLVVYKGEVYSGYMLISPRKGKGSLSKNEVTQCVGLIEAGAISTIDTLLDENEIDEKTQVVVGALENIHE